MYEIIISYLHSPPCSARASVPSSCLNDFAERGFSYTSIAESYTSIAYILKARWDRSDVWQANASCTGAGRHRCPLRTLYRGRIDGGRDCEW